jgi:hypothetical protein
VSRDLTPPADAPDLLALRDAAEARGMRLPLTTSEYQDDYPTIHNDGAPYGSAAQVDNVPFARYLVAAANAVPGLMAEADRLRAVEAATPGSQRDAIRVMRRIAEVMSCEPADSDDLIESVRLLVRDRDTALARVAALEQEVARLRAAAKPAVTISLLTGADQFDEWRDAVRVDVNGVMVGAEEFGSAPEDNSGSRAYRWVPLMLAALATRLGATVERRDEHDLDAGAFDDKICPPDKETP